jgi:rod shape-determining protein MreB
MTKIAFIEREVALNVFSRVQHFFSAVTPDIAMDLGTANTLVYVRGRGIVINEPSVVALDRAKRDVLSVGQGAKEMLGKTPDSILAIRPMKDGVIADFRLAEEMIKHFIRAARGRRGVFRPRVAICVPKGITDVERRAVRDSALHAGTREVILVEEPIAAAIGVGLPIHEPRGSMVVDVGGGTTEVAVLALEDIVTSTSIRVAGDEIDEAIDNYLKKAYNLLVGEQTAEKIKKTVCSAYPLEREEHMAVKGRDLVAGIPKTLTISSREMRDAIREPLSQIIGAVRDTLEQTPPELASDIIDEGVVLCGGGSLLRGLDLALNKETNLTIRLAENPLTCIVLGTGKVLEDPKKYDKVIIREI